MKLTIREYRDSDLGVCKCLWAELTERHRLIYDDQTIGGADPGGGIEDYLRNPWRHATWVAEAVGQVVGMTGLIVHGTEAEIEPAVVTAACRSRGVGRALVARAVDEAKRIGTRFLSVRPVARNVEAVSFLITCGFGIIGHVDLFQDLAPSQGRQWKDGIMIHGHKLRY
jgi:GNAT superfamily N-acetyltransferase